MRYLTIPALAASLASCETVAPTPYSGYAPPPPSSYYPSGYYPYAPPPHSDHASSASRNQHAYDVGYRVGGDDFHAGHSKRYVKHPDLYDDDTRPSFARGYESGYDAARNRDRR